LYFWALDLVAGKFKVSMSPRVAVIGGGIAGSMAAFSLRAVGGATPVVFDAGKRIGGRIGGGTNETGPGGDNGAQFFRASTQKFGSLLKFLESHHIVGPWEGEFGILGTRSGRDGFLSRTHMPTELLGSLKPGGSLAHSQALAVDTGDFCGFIEGQGTLYSGIPSNGSVCPQILQLCGAEVRTDTRVTSVRRISAASGGWQVTSEADQSEIFDAVIFATHDASVPAACITELATDTHSPEVHERLQELTKALLNARANRVPVFTLSAEVACGGEVVPFDAVTVHGSQRIQFLVRDSSKPGRIAAKGKKHELWTCISSSALAAWVLSKNNTTAAAFVQAQHELTEELSTILAPFYDTPPVVTNPYVRRWSAAFTNATLESWSRQEEECVSLEPFRLAIAGDFVRRHGCPIESAALSGLEAGERVGSWLK